MLDLAITNPGSATWTIDLIGCNFFIVGWAILQIGFALPPDASPEVKSKLSRFGLPPLNPQSGLQWVWLVAFAVLTGPLSLYTLIASYEGRWFEAEEKRVVRPRRACSISIVLWCVISGTVQLTLYSEAFLAWARSYGGQVSPQSCFGVCICGDSLSSVLQCWLWEIEQYALTNRINVLVVGGILHLFLAHSVFVFVDAFGTSFSASAPETRISLRA
jgi:hypothetical protein